MDTYAKRTDVEKYAHKASYDEIKENDFNLNIPRYVDTFEEEPTVDVQKLASDMKKIKNEETQVTDEIKQAMDELVGTDEEAQKVLDQLKEIL